MMTLLLVLLLANAHAEQTSVPLSSLGNGTALLDADYSIPVRYEIGSQLTTSQCAAGSDLLMTGATRVTGAVSCIKKIVKPCGPGHFADSLRAQISTTTSLEYNCRPIARATCPADYVWQKIDLGQLDPGPGVAPQDLDCSGVGSCVYRWANHIPWQGSIPPGNMTWTGEVCNPNVYKASGACGVQVTNQSGPGTCYYSCAPCDSKGNCSTCSYQAWPSAYPTAINIDPNDKAKITCSVVLNQPCGTWIQAYATGAGTCELIKPETAPPNGKCSP